MLKVAMIEEEEDDDEQHFVGHITQALPLRVLTAGTHVIPTVASFQDHLSATNRRATRE